MIDHAGALAALADPRTTAQTLAQIAQAYPDLWSGVALHPQAYPALLDWLVERGDPQTTAAVQSVRAPQRPPAQGTPSFAPGNPSFAPAPVIHPASLAADPTPQPANPAISTPQMIQMGVSGVQKAFDSITGFEGEAIIRFRDLFRDTLKRHSRSDMDALMYAGTEAAKYDRQWRLPWLYSRVFAVLLAAYLLLWLCMAIFRDTSGNVVPGVIFTGALVVPATVMIFFWEFNQAKNVSFFDVVRIFFIGGAMSILLLFIVSAATDLFQTAGLPGVLSSGVQALFIGFTEELAKAVVVFVLVRKLYGCLISNGLLVGAIVGTGFGVFETMGYGTSAWVAGDLEYTLFVRGVLSVGNHVVWTAISGAAIMLAQAPGSSQVRVRTLQWKKFAGLFCVPFVLHFLWDFVAFEVNADAWAYILLAGLTVIAWIFIVRLINSGLRQYAALISQN
ncbi:MAG: PrsW family glutamic-type intramembrane protease [Propionibacteriaceae bacterium]|nr:PrsW family glutamic-type intramembrane protease [Propionibacteriaceae bacterium]